MQWRKRKHTHIYTAGVDEGGTRVRGIKEEGVSQMSLTATDSGVAPRMLEETQFSHTIA